jgi:hypothetical protein
MPKPVQRVTVPPSLCEVGQKVHPGPTPMAPAVHENDRPAVLNGCEWHEALNAHAMNPVLRLTHAKPRLLMSIFQAATTASWWCFLRILATASSGALVDAISIFMLTKHRREQSIPDCRMISFSMLRHYGYAWLWQRLRSVRNGSLQRCWAVSSVRSLARALPNRDITVPRGQCRMLAISR